MEVTSFVLGMLTIVTVVFVTGIVVGLLRILKLTNRINDLEMRLDREVEHIDRRFEDEHTEVWRQFENAGRDVTMVERTIMNQMDARRSDAIQAIDELNRAVANESSEGRRYTDSRVDKLIDAYFDIKKVSEKKEVLKG
jgi:uncharacterized membrane-anchored protein YhcB (DUF1043 family)